MSNYKDLSDNERFNNCYNAFKPLEEMLKGLNKIHTEEVEMDAIYLEKPVIYNKDTGRLTCRMEPGDQIRVENGIIVREGLEDATHKVLSCHGTISSSKLSVLLWNIEANEIKILKIK